MHVPDLADVLAFLRVVEAGGFRAAATRHGASASSLSDAVQRLERDTGIRLLNRTTRSVTLTEAGGRLTERLRPAFAEVASAFDGLNQENGAAGTLRIDVPGIVARHVLPPIAAAFLAANPRVRLEVSVTEGLVDVLAAGCTAGIRYDEHLAADMVAVPIGPRWQRFAVVGAPRYLEVRGTPRHPRDLLNHDCIVHMFPGGRTPAWEFERDQERVRVAPRGKLVAASTDMQVAAAIAGLGILFTFGEIVADALKAGNLLTILEDWQQEFRGPFLYFPRSHRRDPPLAAFLDFLKTTSSGDEVEEAGAKGRIPGGASLSS